jgi:hypothetical protein
MPLTARLVAILDRYIGATHRLVAQSPHIAELTTSKDALSAATFDALDRRIRSLLIGLLSEAGITRDGSADMSIAAGKGTLYSDDCAELPYRARLAEMVNTLVTGLTCEAKG